MEAHVIQQADYLDILFNNRNKLYGSYVQRKYHGRRMLQALTIVISGCMVMVAWGLLPNNNKTVGNTIIPVYDTVELTDPEKFKQPKPEEVKPEPPAVKSTVENPPPVIKPDELVTELPLSIDSFTGKESGRVAAEGSSDSNTLATNTKGGNGTAVVANQAPVPMDFSEVMPAFKGDVYAFLNENVRYPRAAIQNGVQGRVVVQFVVYEDGSINDAKVTYGIGGGCDEEAIRVIKAMPDWEPGVNNGKKVRVNYRLPIKFQLD